MDPKVFYDSQKFRYLILMMFSLPFPPFFSFLFFFFFLCSIGLPSPTNYNPKTICIFGNHFYIPRLARGDCQKEKEHESKSLSPGPQRFPPQLVFLEKKLHHSFYFMCYSTTGKKRKKGQLFACTLENAIIP
eukprot:TRINITY_DN12981_c0_g2_i1.p1 TRINITY_DN12981_c0_g2~~TRINITY_DN12981_c0_g2_i1.p1  ORF type:complete len:132 (+),score=0.27 TRINITY_DN12981_c0_g2_i1:441-836(+)